MKNKRNFKENFLEFFAELGAGVIVAFIGVVLLLVGCIVISLLPEKLSEMFFELAALIGFFTLLLLLYVVSKVIEVVRKIKTNFSKTPTAQEKNNPPDDK